MAVLDRKRFFRFLFVFTAGWFSSATALESDEYSVKAAFIYNFAKFVEWPNGSFEDTTTPFDLCIVGASNVADKLNTISDKKAQGRPFHVHSLNNPVEATFCHIVYYAGDQYVAAGEKAKRLNTQGLLTIGDSAQFVEGGGIIAFTVQNNKVQFRINIDAAHRAHLRISSKLLQLAEIYREEK